MLMRVRHDMRSAVDRVKRGCESGNRVLLRSIRHDERVDQTGLVGEVEMMLKLTMRVA